MIVVSLIERMGTLFFNSFTLWWKQNESFSRKYRACRFFPVPLSSEVRVWKGFSISYHHIRELCREKCLGLVFNQDEAFREMLLRLKKEKSWEERWRPRVNRKRCWFNWTTVAFKRSLSRDKVARKWEWFLDSDNTICANRNGHWKNSGICVCASGQFVLKGGEERDFGAFCDVLLFLRNRLYSVVTTRVYMADKFQLIYAVLTI